MNALVSTRNVTKIYNKNQLPRLNKVSFDIQAGEFVGIMGASGSGKTTLLNILSTIDTPTDGDVFVNTEKQILQLLCDGYKRKEIASMLYASERTISNHIQHVFDKLNVSSSLEAVTKGIKLGYIQPTYR
ncbi:Lipoprotein-releasing system ATP-binding protein LolD 1 [Bacillus cereus 95/8201]|uniref:ABC transporter family protein n=1 Tax=Bacillus thuringiensis TaxID=1428 RepID=A0A0B5NRQ1_BACTU|nr:MULTISPECIES: ATP-binding cassette domain-containing protein [Bacillus cereus group]AJG74773.1 ABC transporter family protein [Bacillus thuringiensis]AJH60841.1 ABC transporter family protein [Bacillus cereus]AJK35228.1 ABC transporter family protein [Bacillus cereus]EEL16387.1 Lipoprotein-releasing system ATP-binding protein LolD 1 [Bacillus cereus 95/8201]EEM76868.1 Lipoprotein-releasing system ATP-binding protein LolD 1 [Bacillus thuringiensis serovar pondicheriensis BGSC 4BA1]